LNLHFNIDRIDEQLRAINIDVVNFYAKIYKMYSITFAMFCICFMMLYTFLAFEDGVNNSYLLAFMYPNFYFSLKIWQILLYFSIPYNLFKQIEITLNDISACFEYNAVLKNRKYGRFLEHKLKKLIKVYDLIYDYTELVNQCFGISFLYILLQNNIHIMTLFYWIIFEIYKNRTLKSVSSVSNISELTIIPKSKFLLYKNKFLSILLQFGSFGSSIILRNLST
jgi:hypothetical protein